MYLGYLIGIHTQPEVPSAIEDAFLVSNLSIQPVEVEPNEIVTMAVLVVNTHDTWGLFFYPNH